MTNAEVAVRLLDLARELSPLVRVVVAVIPHNEGEDEAVVDMVGVDHEDIAQVISELAFWLSDCVTEAMHESLETIETLETKEQPS